MYYEDESARLGILGGFALGAVFGAGVGLLLRGSRRRGAAGDAVARARRLRGPARRGLAGDGAAGRVARRRFRL